MRFKDFLHRGQGNGNGCQRGNGGHQRRLRNQNRQQVVLQEQPMSGGRYQDSDHQVNNRSTPLSEQHAVLRPARPMSIVQAVVDQSLCTGCGLCQEICPVQAIVLIQGKAQVQEECIGCGICIMNCETQAITID